MGSAGTLAQITLYLKAARVLFAAGNQHEWLFSFYKAQVPSIKWFFFYFWRPEYRYRSNAVDTLQLYIYARPNIVKALITLDV